MAPSQVVALVATLAAASVGAQVPPSDAHRRLFPLGDVRLEGGAVLPNATLAYATLGTLNTQRSNAVLLPSWYGSDHHGYDFLIGPGRALDPARDYIVLTEMFANGWSSSPSNTPAPFNGPRFPAIAIRDNVSAVHRLLTSELGVTHLRAIVGFSMGAQQAFQWAVSHPAFTDRIVAYCGTAKTYPHGVVRLEGAISALAADAAFADGNYTTPPRKGLAAWSRHWAGWVFSQEWWRRELFKPRWSSVDAVLEDRTNRDAVRDANNLISQARTWQRHNVGETSGFNGDHERALRSIQAPVLYMPCETDLYFPVGDARYESGFIAGVRLVAVPSLWGHSAGSGGNPADNDFIDRQIGEFLK
jgi:homoserine O-acetyltransferase/O-succinyltransferase